MCLHSALNNMQYSVRFFVFFILSLQPSMKKVFQLLIFLVFLSSCKSSYEKVRTSNDQVLMLKTANKLFADKEYFKASTLYDLIFSSYRGQKESEDIYFNNAYCNYYLSNYETANYMFSNYSNTFFNSPRREEAEFMAAYSIYKTSPNYKLDQTPTTKAIDLFQNFANTHPESPKVEECNKLIDELRAKLEYKAFEQGKLYFNLQHYQGALSTLDNLLNEFPDTKNEKEIRLLMIKSSYEWAEKSIFEKQKERYLKTLDLINSFNSKFPTDRNKEVKDIKNKSLNKLKNPLYDGHKDTSSKS